jgi:hypothetical protein
MSSETQRRVSGDGGSRRTLEDSERPGAGEDTTEALTLAPWLVNDPQVHDHVTRRTIDFIKITL